MNVKSIIIVVIGFLVSVTAYSQQPKETTMDLLMHAVWEHGKPTYGDYCQLIYTDSIVTMRYPEPNGEMGVVTWKYYLTDKEEFSFDKTKIGKAINGGYYMRVNEHGTFSCVKIMELSRDSLVIIPMRVNGKRRTSGAAWNYTPMRP